MSMTLLWALICLIIFIAVLAHPKLPNWMTFICLAPVALFSGIMESGDIYAVLNSSSLPGLGDMQEQGILIYLFERAL